MDDSDALGGVDQIPVHGPMREQALDLRRNAVLLLVGQGISSGGDQLATVAVTWLVVSLTGSAQSLALLTTFLTVSTVALSLVSGVFIDRWNQRAVLVATDLARATLFLGPAALVASAHVSMTTLTSAGAVIALAGLLMLAAALGLARTAAPRLPRLAHLA